MKSLIFLVSFSCMVVFSRAQTFAITGKVLHAKDRQPVIGATLVLQNTSYHAAANEQGDYILKSIVPGQYVLEISSVGFTSIFKPVILTDSNLKIDIFLSDNVKNLDSVIIRSGEEKKSGFSRLRDVEGTAIYAGKKTEVIVLKDVVANKATNNSRQVYAKVAGLNIWENDGAGIQLAIGGRGLSPNRVANFNTRQNGYDISADALGYPESYYTPAIEAVDRIEIVRGAASLQYGTQFGGMINFRLNRGVDSEKATIVSRLTGGSWDFLNSSTSIGGTVNKLNYYSFYQHKSGNGWRPNSDFNSNNAYAAATYTINVKLSFDLQYTFMNYLEHQPGGLTDADFAQDPHQSTRKRNWFRVNWNLGSISLDYKFNDRLKFNSRFFGLTANRDALGILTFINRADDGTADRNLYIDQYNNWGNESRLLYTYKTGNISSTALLGFRYYQGHTNRQQGFGNNGEGGTTDDFTFNRASSADTFRYSCYLFPNHNLAVFAENIFRINTKWSIIPGLRFENITTRAQGSYTNVTFDLAGNPINPQKVIDSKESRRHFILGGIGVTYNIIPGTQAYANISQNYKAINFNDLRTLNPNLRVDSSLQDEKGYSADIGIRKATGILNYDISFFIINYDNKIGSILSVDPANFIIYNLRTNVSQSRHIGLESYIEADVWKWIKGAGSRTNLSLFTNFSIINAQYIHSKEAANDGRKVEFVPDVIFKTGIAFRRNRFAASYQFSYTGQQFTDATNAYATANAIDGIIPSYNVMDISAEYRISKLLTVYGTINNIRDKKYFTRRADSYPGPGIVPSDARSFYITLQIKL